MTEIYIHIYHDKQDGAQMTLNCDRLPNDIEGAIKTYDDDMALYGKERISYITTLCINQNTLKTTTLDIETERDEFIKEERQKEIEDRDEESRQRSFRYNNQM